MPTACFSGRLTIGTTWEEFSEWVIEFDYPRVAEIPSIISQRIFRVVGEVESKEFALPGKSRLDYIEVIEFTNLSDYARDLQQHARAHEISAQLPRYVDLKSVAAVHGETVSSSQVRRWNPSHTPLIMMARRKCGITKELHSAWMREIYLPLLKQLNSLERIEVFTIESALAIAGTDSMAFDHLRIAHVVDVRQFVEEFSVRLGSRLIARLLPEILDLPVVANVECKFISPGVFRGNG